MKQYIILVILLLLPFTLNADVDTLEGEELTDSATIEGVDTTDTVEGQVVTAGGAAGGCPVGAASVAFSWNGDHASGSDYGCEVEVPEQASSNTGAIHADYGRTGNGYMFTNPNEYLEWAVTADDKIDDEIGTIWMWVYTPNGGLLQNNTACEAYGDSSNRIWLQLQGVERIRSYDRHNGTEDSVYPSMAITPETWTLVGMSWRVDDGLDLAGTVNDGDATYWEAGETLEEDDDLTAFGTAISLVGLGEHNTSSTSTDEIWIDDFYVLKTYKADYPGP